MDATPLIDALTAHTHSSIPNHLIVNEREHPTAKATFVPQEMVRYTRIVTAPAVNARAGRVEDGHVVRSVEQNSAAVCVHTHDRGVRRVECPKRFQIIRVIDRHREPFEHVFRLRAIAIERVSLPGITRRCAEHVPIRRAPDCRAGGFDRAIEFVVNPDALATVAVGFHLEPSADARRNFERRAIPQFQRQLTFTSPQPADIDGTARRRSIAA